MWLSGSALLFIFTFRTASEYLKDMRANIIAIFTCYGVFKLLDQALIQMDAAAAVVANNVMVVFAWLN